MNSGEGPDTEDVDDLIGRIYDVALEPERYEELLDTRDSTIWPADFGTEADPSKLTGTHALSHFQRVGRVLMKLADSEPITEVEALLAKFPSVATIVFSLDLKVSALNPAASHLFNVSPGASMLSLPVEPEDRARLTRQVSRMLGNSDAKPSILRVRAAQGDAFMIFQMRRMVLLGDIPVVVAVTSDIRWPAGFDNILRDAFQLSGAEIAVTKHLLDCRSVKEVAQKRGRSIDTIRAQIKSILAKTEVNGQVELVRLVLSMKDIATYTPEDAAKKSTLSFGTGTLRPLPYHTTYGADGRRLDYLILGDPYGTPVLYLPTAFAYSRWPATAEEEAAKRGLKIISPIRAGYGLSDPVPDDANFCQTVAQDLLAVLDAEQAGPVPVLSVAIDHYFAIEMEKLRPGTMAALVATAGGLPYLNRQQVERMHKWHRFTQATARYTPYLLPYLVKTELKLIRRSGMQAFMHTTFKGSPADIATLATPGVMEALIAGTIVAVSEDYSAHAAFTRQTVFEQGDWLIDHVHWLKGRMPVHFLNGLQDPAMPAETLAEHQIEFDWIDFRIYPDAGHLMFFTNWAEVLDLVEEYT